MPKFMEHTFSDNPVSVNIPRSTFNRDFRHKTSFNEGSLIPFYFDEVLPGDTFNVRTNALVRLSNPAVRPVMDDMYLDVYYFFVPSRILWKHFEEVHGENKATAWTQPTEYVLPVEGVSDTIDSGSFYGYCGLPSTASANGLNLLPYAAYCKIWNEWFRDENLEDPDPVVDAIYNLGNNAPLATQAVSVSGIHSVSRYHDYFSSCLPAPQKGAAVDLPLGDSAPVSITTVGNNLFLGPATVADEPVSYSSGVGNKGYLYADGTALSVSSLSGTGTADLSSATAANINQLRQAFQLQRLFERDARGGTRFTEKLKSHFGVTNGDARLQRPEFLGGKHQLLSMQQVSQTAPSSGTGNALGQLGAYSVTGMSEGSFVKSFTEFGYVVGVACVRVKHSYAQGVSRMFTRKRRFDYYYPALANIGEQPVYTRELYAPSGVTSTTIFGYQEAWADYRYKPDMVTGMLRPGQDVDMTAWTYSDHYMAAPTLSAGWVKEVPDNIDQTLAVPSRTADQFIADFGVSNKCTRPMPLYSIPGLIDHN